VREIRTPRSMRGVWKRNYGRAAKAPPDERGGNGYARPIATAPHPDSTLGGGSGVSALNRRSRPNAADARNSCAAGAGAPLQYISLPSRTGDPILRLRLDRPATVGEVAPHFLTHGAAYLLRQCSKCLASGGPTAFKGAVIGIE
jgi:hypothetical protein